MRELKGLTIVMMGASGGIGSATAKLVSKPGVNIALCASRIERLSAVAEEVRAAGAEVYFAEVDVTDETQVTAFMEEVFRRFGRLDILINFAGLSVSARLEQLGIADYDRVMDVNVKGMFLSTKAFCSHVNDDEGALIINFGSMASKRANPGAPHYSAAKAAVNMFTEGLAQQLKGRNIRMTVMNPGPTDTSFFEGRIPPEKRGDFMRPDDVAEVLEFIMTRDKRINIHDIMFDSFDFFKR